MPIKLLNATKPWDIIPYVNEVTHFWFGKFMLIVFFLIAYLVLGRLPAEKAFAGAAFFVNIIAVIFWYFDIINTGSLIFALAGLLISMIIVGLKK